MVCLVALYSTAHAQDSAESLLAEAEALYQQPDATADQLAEVRALLDQIIDRHPTSDIALSVLLGENVGAIDVSDLNARLDAGATASTDDIAVGQPQGPTPLNEGAEVAPADQSAATVEATPPELAPGSDATEATMELEKQDIRDLQARLLVLGHDPNGVDGVLGRGTRSALGAWQSAQGIAPTGFLNPEQYAWLRQVSDPQLAIWRADPENEKRYLPPPPIAIGPSNMAGNWRYTTNCGANSRVGRARVNGIMSMRHVGSNNYAGTLRNSEGLRASLNATLRGRQVSGTANFGFLFGRVTLSARVDDQALILRGRDSNRCSFFARKS